MARWSLLLAAVAAGAVVTLASGAARASGDLFADCGGAVFNGNEQCTVTASGGCTAACAPPKLVVACSAKLEAGCTGGCTATLPSCETSCQGSCDTACQANPGNFSCSADCEGTCQGNCSSTCSSMSGDTNCEAECKAACGARCDAGCTGQPPGASCSGACQGSCQGSCTGQANLSCDIQCQAQGQVSCAASLQTNCEASCNANAAIFCNGQFINPQDANACVDDLKSLFNIKVEGWSYATSSCDGGVCSAQAAAGGQASASCDLAPSGTPPLSGGLLALGLGSVVAGVVRRRARTG